MFRLSSALFLIVLSTQLLAQSSNQSKVPMAALSEITTYCNTIEHESESQTPRIFAQRGLTAGASSGWEEFESRVAWRQAGSPKPVALVWYRDAKIAHVRVAPDDRENSRVYVDYCYRNDGRLARLRPTPRVQRNCDPSGYQCKYVLRLERLYPADGPVLTMFGYFDGEGFVKGQPFDGVPYFPGILNGPWLSPEHTELVYLPITWPEYANIADLPFSGLSYATLK